MTGVLKIMVAVSDPDPALSLEAELRARNFTVVLAGDAAQANSVARREKPDAALLDASLSGGAKNLLVRLGASLVTAAMPVIVITGNQSPESKELISAGARDCVEPPVDVDALVKSIREHVKRPNYLMEAPPQFLRSPERMSALKKTRLLDSPASDQFDDITKLAAKILGVPVTLVSLVDKDRQFFKSESGLPEPWSKSRETPLSHSFCQWVVSGKEHLVVNDAREHPVLKNNLAIRDLGVIAYAGLPLNSGKDQVIGSFCAIDSNPHKWKMNELTTLRHLSHVVEAYIALDVAKNPSASNGPPVILHSAGAVSLLQVLAKGIEGAVGVLRLYNSKLSESEREALMGIIEVMSQQQGQLITSDL